MNSINLPEEKYALLVSLCSVITKLRESVKEKLFGAGGRDYNSAPEVCVKILLIIDYIHENITKNQVFLKRKLGSVYDLSFTWFSLIRKEDSTLHPIYLNLVNSQFMSDLMTSIYQSRKILTDKFDTTNMKLDDNMIPKTNDLKLSFTDKTIVEICDKYLKDVKENAELTSLLMNFYDKIVSGAKFSDHEIDQFLLKTGKWFPRYIIKTLLSSVIPNKVIDQKLLKLSVPKYWSSEKQSEHGQTILRNSKIPIAESIKNILEKVEKKISQIEKDDTDLSSIWTSIKEKQSLSLEEICIYVYLLWGRIPSANIITSLGISYTMLNKIKQALNLKKLRQRRSKEEKSTTTILAKKENTSTPITMDFSGIEKIVLLPSSGSIQVTFKYGCPEHKQYMMLLSEKT